MRELILLRHAHAGPAAAGVSDRARPLSAAGRHEAHAAGRWLAEHGYRPDRVLCSDALRARETGDQALAAVGGGAVTDEPRIYEATPGELFEIIEAHRDATRLLLIGHNPGFEQLTALLTTGQSGDFRGMPTAGIAVLNLPHDAAFEPGAAQLAAFWSP